MSTLANNPIEGKILDTTGPIFAERNGSRIALKINDPIYESDVITTGSNTTADIEYRDGTKSRIAPNTKFKLTDYEFEENGDASFVMNITQGAVRTVSGEIVERNPEAFEVITPRATVGIRGTEFINTVDNASNSETHAVLFISNGHVMLVTAPNGESISMTQPLQVTRYSAPTGDFSGVQTTTLGQMESIIYSFAPTLSTEIPRTAGEQGQWDSVQRILNDERSEEEKKAKEDAEEAAQNAIDNPPPILTQGNTIVLSLDPTAQVDLDDIIESLEEAGYNVLVIPQDENSDNLNQLQANANNAFEKPDLSTDDINVPIDIHFTRYTGGNFTDVNGVQYTPNEIANSVRPIYMQGFEISNTTVTTGSGDDVIALGASYNNGVFTNLTSTSPLDSALSYATINTGAGDDILYIHNDYPDGSTISGGSINMGDGDDTLTITSATAERPIIDMGSGNNTVNLNYDNISFTLSGGGNNTINFNTTTNAHLMLGETTGTNTVNVTTATNSDINIYGNGNYSLNIGTFSNSALQTIQLENGDNSVTIGTLHGATGGYKAILNTDGHSGAGNDTVNIANARYAEVNTGSGNDRITIMNFDSHDPSATSIYINTGDGDDFVQLSTLLYGNTTGVSGALEAGNDFLLVTKPSATSENGILNGGDGFDVAITSWQITDPSSYGYEVNLVWENATEAELSSLNSEQNIANILGVKFTPTTGNDGTIHLLQNFWTEVNSGEYQYKNDIDIKIYAVNDNVNFINDQAAFNTIAI